LSAKPYSVANNGYVLEGIELARPSGMDVRRNKDVCPFKRSTERQHGAKHRPDLAVTRVEPPEALECLDAVVTSEVVSDSRVDGVKQDVNIAPVNAPQKLRSKREEVGMLCRLVNERQSRHALNRVRSLSHCHGQD
jgi:hypothetical protein